MPYDLKLTVFVSSRKLQQIHDPRSKFQELRQASRLTALSKVPLRTESPTYINEFKT